MIPELGHVALILALQLALLQALLGLIGAARGHAGAMALARSAATGQLVLVLLGYAALFWAFYSNDFSVVNVAEHSSRRLPPAYRLTAAWGAHEGSFLLWTSLSAGWSVAFVLLSRKLPAELRARVVGVMGLLGFCFLAFILFTSNPFMRLHPPPADGGDLNPLLQDPGMILHPPLLYMGYVGFSVAFAFAIAALLAGRVDQLWARWVRPWALVGWVFLTLGVMVGSWWAYYELGWGGWWFWDPSENASLMPWLAGTALVHSLAVTDQRANLRVWTVFLAIGTFSLSLLGTFLIRSGVLSSVHSFAQDPARGLFILVFLSMVIGGALLLFARRAKSLRSGAEPLAPVISRGSAILGGNVLLLVALATVLLGTLYPLLLDVFGLGKISVGAPYFNAVFVPIMVPVLLLLGIAPRLRWQPTRLSELARSLRWHGAAALALAISIPFAVGEFKWQAALGVGLAAWIVFTTLEGWLALRRRTAMLPLSAIAGGLAHLGLALGIAGIGLVSAYQSERSVALTKGETAALGGYEFVFQGAVEVPASNYSAMRATVAVRSDGQPFATLLPEKRIYRTSRLTMTEAAIRYGFAGDVYVALGEPLHGGAWSVQLYIKPFVGWLWAGALMMALGGLLAAVGLAGQSNRRSAAI